MDNKEIEKTLKGIGEEVIRRRLNKSDVFEEVLHAGADQLGRELTNIEAWTITNAIMETVPKKPDPPKPVASTFVSDTRDALARAGWLGRGFLYGGEHNPIQGRANSYDGGTFPSTRSYLGYTKGSGV